MSYRAYATTDPLGKRLTERREALVQAIMDGQHGGDPYKLGELVGRAKGLDEAMQDLLAARREEADLKGDEL